MKYMVRVRKRDVTSSRVREKFLAPKLAFAILKGTSNPLAALIIQDLKEWKTTLLSLTQ